MTPEQITEQLENIPPDEYFPANSAELVASWTASNVGVECAEPIFRFVETHPEIDFGTPGALVHFLECLRSDVIQEKLIESVNRTPQHFTLWMINRAINATKEEGRRRELTTVLENALSNPRSDKYAVEIITFYLAKITPRPPPTR